MSSFTFSILSSLTLAILFALFQSVLLTSLVWKSFCGINSNRLSQLTKSQKSVQLAAVGCYASFMISAIMIVIIRFHDLYIEGVTNYFSCISMTTRILYQIFMYLGWNCVYIFMFTRLYATFEDSDFKVTKRTIYIHIIIVIFCMFASWTLIVLAKIQFCTIAVLDTLYGLSCIPPLFAQIYLVFSFNHRLFKMALQVKHQSLSLSPSHSRSHRDREKIRLSEKQRFVLSVVRKHTILGVVLLFAMLIAMIAYILAVNVYAKSANHTSPLIIYPHYLIFGTYLNSTCWLTIFDIIHTLCLSVITFSIYLGFSTNKTYYLCFCDSIDWKCKELCESLAGAKINDTGYGNLNATEMSETVINVTKENTTEISL